MGNWYLEKWDIIKAVTGVSHTSHWCEFVAMPASALACLVRITSVPLEASLHGHSSNGRYVKDTIENVVLQAP